MDDARAVELVNMLTVARLSTLGALTRLESRGAHHRSDSPRTDDLWCAHLVQSPLVDTAGGRVRRVTLARAPMVSETAEARL